MKSRRPFVIVGVGRFGRETADAVLAAQARGSDDDLLGFVDDAPSTRNLDRISGLGLTYLGTVESWSQTTREAEFVVGIGAPGVRAAIAMKLESAGHRSRSVIHPDATVGIDAIVGSGTVICAGARIATNVTLGAHTHVNANATVGHDTICENFVSINPGALVSGDCRIGSGSLIGVGAAVLQGLDIGKRVTVGGSACVTRAIPDDRVVRGVPAR